MKNLSWVVLVLALCLVPSAGAADPAGVPNFHRVNEHLLRGGQPSERGFTSLAELGVKTVVDLRRKHEHSDAEARIVEAAGMRYVNVPMDGFETPRPDQLAKILELLDTEEQVFVHCKLGMDRTGTVMAIYRMEREHWTNDHALAEALSFGLHWYEVGMKRLIRGYAPSQPRDLAQASSQPRDLASASLQLTSRPSIPRPFGAAAHLRPM